MIIKKAIALIVILCLLYSSIGAFCESSDVTYFSTLFLKVADLNAKEWMSSDQNRALFAACALMDYLVQDDKPYDITSIYSGLLYIGRSAFIIAIGYNEQSRSDSLVIMFDTRDNTQAGFSVVPLSKSSLELGMENICTDGYSKIDVVDLKEVMDAIQETVS